MEVAASIITIVELSVSLTFTCVEYAKAVKVAAEEAAALHKELGSLVQVLSRLQHPTVSSALKTTLEPDLKSCRKDLLRLQSKLKPVVDGASLRQTLLWPFKQHGEFRRVTVRIQKYFALFDKAVAVSTLEMTDNIMKQLSELRQSREADRSLFTERFDELGKDVAEVRDVAKNEKYEKAMRWFKVVDYEQNYSENIAILNPNTCRWFLKEGQYFTQWLQCTTGSQQNILVQGRAGSGKTMLMSSAVKMAHSFQFFSKSEACIVYYYFDFRDTKKYVMSMLWSLIHQLCSQTYAVPEQVAKLQKFHTAAETVSRAVLVQILAQQCSEYDKLFFIIDALDECEGVQDFSDVVADLLKSVATSTDVRFLCFSREESTIKRSLAKFNFSVKSLESNAVGLDIATYVRDTLEKDRTRKFKVFHGCNESIREQVISTLELKSEGIFRWAQCQLDAISHCRSAREIKEVLSTLPSTLNKTYERIFKELSRSPYDLRRANCILTWLLGTNNSMTTGMLLEALTIDCDRLEIDEEDRVQDPDAISDICRSLVRESAHKDGEMWPNCKIVTVAHSTVEQYILSPQAGKFRLHWEDIHVRLARSCLTLSKSPIWERLKEIYTKDDFDPRSGGDIAQLLDYACGDLFSRLQNPGVEEKVVGDVIGVLVQDERLQCLRKNCLTIDLWNSEFETPFPTALHINIKEWHSESPNAELLTRFSNISHTSSVLSKAILAGLPRTTFFMIEHAIDLNTVDTYYRTPLALLVAIGDNTQVKRFVVKSRERYNSITTANLQHADSSLRSIISTFVNGLFTAIHTRSNSVFYMLFHETIECLNLIPDRSYRAKLLWQILRLCVALSAANGSRELLEYLCQQALESNSLGSKQVTQLAQEALYISVCERQANCIQCLLDCGASPTSRVFLQHTSLMSRYSRGPTLDNLYKIWASFLDPDLLVEQLDDYIKGSDFPEMGPRTALKAGIDDFHLAFKLLGGSSSTYLANQHVFQAAVERWLLRFTDDDIPQYFIGDLKKLQELLLEYMELPGNRDRLDIALVICSGKGQERTDIVKKLLAKGADPNCSVLRSNNIEATTPLVAACKMGHVEVVKILLEAGADPDIEDKYGGLPSIATFGRFRKDSNCEQIFRLLLEKKPDLKLKSTRALINPLSWFDQYGYSFQGGSALSAFIYGSIDKSQDIPADFLKSTGLLLDLDSYLIGDDYGTPLIAASATNQTHFVDFLLEHGATTNAQGHPDTEWSLPALAAIYGGHGELALKLLKDQEKCIETSDLKDKWSKALMFTLGHDKYFPDQDKVALKLMECDVNLNFVMEENTADSVNPLGYDDFDDYDEYDDDDYIRPSLLSFRPSLLNWGTPMLAACAGAKVEFIKLLQRKNADERPSRTSLYGDCLTAACSSGQVDATEIFIKRGDDVNKWSQGRVFWCPLIAAAQVGYSMSALEVVKILLTAGSRANKVYPFQNPAAKLNDLEVMILDWRKSLHFTLLWKRMWDNCKITGASILQAKPFYGSPFIAATCGQDEDIMKLIAEQEGVDVDQELSCGFYPTAMMACLEMKKMHQTVGTLHELGASPITASQILNFSYPFRAMSGDLVQENAFLNVPNSFWGNMITLCVNTEIIIPYLLYRGVDPNEVVPGSFYGSAWIAAAALLRTNAVVCFLEHGCATNTVVPNSPFGTALIAVCSGPAHYPFQYSYRSQYDLNDPVNWSMVQYDLLQILLDKGADPNVTFGHFSPLIALVLCDTHKEYKTDSLRMLLEHGADPTVMLPQWGYDEINSEKQWSAISIAERKGDVEIKSLLEQYVGGSLSSRGIHVELVVEEKIRWIETEP